MSRPICVLIVLLSLASTNVLGLSIRQEGSTSSAPFELNYANIQSPLVMVLQIANDSSTAVTILSWQLIDLELQPVGGSGGTLAFQEGAAPPDSLFGDLPGPETDLLIPGIKISAVDVDPNFIGEPLMQNSGRNILQLTIAASAEAAGPFQLVMPQVTDPEGDSSWFDAAEFAPKAFENSAPSALPGLILLGTINVGQASSFAVGDYNRDGKVDAADYAQWRREFGNSVSTPGQGSDGNRNGFVDAADYIVWRASADLPTGNVVGIAEVAVPEPRGFALLLPAMVGILALSFPFKYSAR